MTDQPWDWHQYAHGGARVSRGNDLVADIYDAEDVDLIKRALTSLEAYEACAAALEWFVQFHSGHVLPPELTNAMRDAGEALRRLRGEAVPT